MNSPKNLFHSFPQLVGSGMLGSLIANGIEIVLTGKSSSAQYPISPIEIGGAITGILAYVHRAETPGVPNQSHTVEGDTTINPSNYYFIHPETNLWNKRALKMITSEEFDKEMLALRISH